MTAARPRYGWYGDDFTGATDTLATLAERGFRALLFLRLPSEAQIAAAGPLDALGIAGATRSMAPDAMTAELAAAGDFFSRHGVDILHYKCCSTFDSAPHVGSIGAAVAALRPSSPNPVLPIVGGQPNLGRYCLFGQLFAAAGSGGQVHRIDRHPTMSVHPVTPMAEADLRLHLGGQGLGDIALVDYRSYEDGHGPSVPAGPVLFDVAHAGDLAAIGRAIRDAALGGPLLAVGPSSVAQALATAWPEGRLAVPAVAPVFERRKGPVLALVGSLSPVTRAQVAAASGFDRVGIDTARLLDDASYGTALRRQVAEGLSAGRDVMMITERPDGAPSAAESVAAATGVLLGAVMAEADIARLVVAGGDTSSLAVRSLDLWGLSYRAALVPGAPLCRGHSDDPRLDGLDIVLKGGQMGPPDFFARAAALG